MSTALDTELLQVAKDLIDEFGTSASFVVPSAVHYDPELGEAYSLAESLHVTKLSPPGAYSLRYVDGDLVRRSDARAFLAAKGLTFTPDRGQRVAVSGQTWVVIEVTELRSGDDVAAYELQLRREA